MLVIGIVGGVASGKSFVARIFGQLGAKVIDVDAIGHEVLAEPSVNEAIRKRWGERVIDEHGNVIRQALAQIVFGKPPDGPDHLAHLESLIHPLITKRIQKQIERYRSEGAQAVVLDAAVLMKANWDRLCDKVVYVQAPRALRTERARARGWTDHELSRRESSQTPDNEKKNRSHVFINGASSHEQTFEQIQHFWNSLFLSS